MDEAAVGRRRRGAVARGRGSAATACRRPVARPAAGARTTSKPRRRPRPVLGRRDADGQERLAGVGGVGRAQPGQIDRRALARARAPAASNAPAGDLDAVDRQRVARAQPAEVGEVLVVRDLDPAAREVRRPTPPIRTGAASRLCSHIAGFGRRSGQTIPSQHEVAVVRLVAEVAAVRPARPPVGQRLDEAVVPELPDEPALEPGRRLDGVPVLGQRAVAVAHRVRVLAHDQRVPLQPGAGVVDDRRRSAGTSGR